MIHTFGKVIGVSVGIVALVFIVVATILYRSGSSAIPTTTALTEAAKDSISVLYPQPALQKPPSKDKAKSKSGQADQTGSTKTHRLSTAKSISPPSVSKTNTRAVASVTKGSTGASKQMTPEEYVEREMYYVNKISDESNQVLQRATDGRAKLDAMKAELEALQYPR